MEITIGLLAAIIGFGIALYIRQKQNAKKPLMCPRKAPCETVLSSPQAQTFGVSNSVLGILYYVAAFFLLLCIGAGGRSIWAEVVLLLLAVGGAGFSGYLVWVQHSVIKQWCVWCLGSALMATVLLVVTVLIVF